MRIARFLLRHPASRRIGTILVFVCCVPPAVPVLAAAWLLGSLARLRPAGRGRLARFAAFAAVYLAVEIAGITWVALYWIGPGRLGRGPLDRAAFEERHYALLRRLLERLFRAARRSFAVRVEPPAIGASVPRGPLIVASRHAGPGDSFLLACALLATVRRRPRFVLSEALALDPFIGTVLRRTPNCFVGLDEERRHRSIGRIAELAGSLGTDDALVIFPEGRNFTAARRARLIERLRRRRTWQQLPVARALEHVLPPRGSGVFAAIDAAPDATHVVFVAHTGLDRIESARDAWRAVPLAAGLEITWWSVPVREIPAEPARRERWLQLQWSRVDSWIGLHRPEIPPEAAPEPSSLTP
jgi:1-acyl-sn-glycerol-3-phosphate acyltransferase